MVRRRLLQLLLPKHPPYFAPSEPEGCRMSYGICVGGFGIAFSTALFSQLFQHSVPGLLRPLKLQQQQQRRRSSKSNRRNSKSADHRPSDHSQYCANNVLNGVPRIFSLALGTTCALYLLLGVSAASFFGSGTRPSVNLCYVLLPPSLLGRTRCIPCACRASLRGRWLQPLAQVGMASPKEYLGQSNPMPPATPRATSGRHLNHCLVSRMLQDSS